MTLYINGQQVNQTSSASTAPRNEPGAFALGAQTADHVAQQLVFAGQVAEFQIYSDNNQNVQSLTNSLGATYGITPVPEPTTWAAGLLSLGVLGYSQRRRLAALIAARRATRRVAA